MDAALRRFVIKRAQNRCEYCGLRQEHQPLVSFHVEHIIARQHSRDDSPENLALACQRCNLQKGANLTGLDPDTREVTRLFHPRQDCWTDHYTLQDGVVIGLTGVGRTTAALLQMNTPDRVGLRLDLVAAGLWE